MRRLGVASMEPLGLDVPMYDITTGTGDFIADGVVSHNCFARKSHTYLDLDAGHDFNTKIVVKVNAPERVRAELAAPRWRGEHIAMGTNVDCYQRAEGRYRLMPGILAALRDAANPFSILTKGTLILRDADLLAEAAEVTDVGLAVSVGSADEDLCRVLEPGAPSPRRRLEVCAAFTGRGLPCAVLMGPVVPFLSDSPAQLAATVRQAATGRRVLGHPDRAAPAPRRAGMVPRLARRAPPGAGSPLPRPVRARRVRAQGLPAAGGRAGPGAGPAVPGRPARAQTAPGVIPRRRRPPGRNRSPGARRPGADPAFPALKATRLSCADRLIRPREAPSPAGWAARPGPRPGSPRPGRWR